MEAAKLTPYVVTAIVTLVTVVAIGAIAAGVSCRDARTVASVMSETDGYAIGTVR